MADDEGFETLTEAAHSRLLRALYEWQNAGGSLDQVVDAIREMVDARLAEGKSEVQK